jgi:excisionase family DNA binding protein
MGQEWVTVAQACRIYGVSRRTLTRWIKQGKLESKIDGNRRLVLTSDIGHGETKQGHDDSSMSQDMSQQELIKQLRSDIASLEKQLETKDKQIEELQKELSEHSQRTDSIIMQLSRNQQLMIESTEQKVGRSWWSRLFRKSSDEAN